nr:TNF receptor-associated factor 6-like [Dermacentor andersoni]
MLDLGRRALRHVCDSVSGVNWRPTRFVNERMLADFACCVCHVIPNTTFVLPCGHALCEQCQRGSVLEDGGSVCPFDGKPFCEDECEKGQIAQRLKQNLEAHCWNEAHGCDFVGPLAVLLQHFEAECAFHVLPCQRCGENIPNAKLAACCVGSGRVWQSFTAESPIKKLNDIICGDGISTKYFWPL